MITHECPKCGQDFPCDVPLTSTGQKWYQINSIVGSALLFLFILFGCAVCNSDAVAKLIHG